jgi:hypothetical protein
MKYGNKGVPSLLASGYFIQVHPEIIRKLGSATQAIVLQQLSYWLERSTKEFDGETWVYNSYENWAENLGLSAYQVQRAMLVLEKLGVVVSCQPEAYNRIKWYRIDTEHEFWILPSCENEPIHQAISLVQTDDTPRSTTYTNITHIQPKESLNLDFDKFWKAFPRKEGRKTAQMAYLKAVKSASDETILAGALEYAKTPREMKYCLLPTSWLNQERWKDERSVTLTIATTPSPRRFTEDDAPIKRPIDLEEIKAVRLALTASKMYS